MSFSFVLILEFRMSASLCQGRTSGIKLNSSRLTSKHNRLHSELKKACQSFL